MLPFARLQMTARANPARRVRMCQLRCTCRGRSTDRLGIRLGVSKPRREFCCDPHALVAWSAGAGAAAPGVASVRRRRVARRAAHLLRGAASSVTVGPKLAAFSALQLKSQRPLVQTRLCVAHRRPRRRSWPSCCHWERARRQQYSSPSTHRNKHPRRCRLWRWCMGGSRRHPHHY